MKIQEGHLRRRALVYLRQSTMQQVHEHAESTKRQYALKRRAEDLGWQADCIDVIDEDLGESGATVERRSGFQHLAEQVSLGHVGAICAIEVSRFSRSSADWHRLLDLCGWMDVLIIDEASILAPSDPNDRLLLGLKGQMSEAERYWMKLRLHGAAKSKARRGELRLPPPTGYVWDPTARRLTLDPDEEIQRTVRLVFERFRIETTAGGVMAYFVNNAIQLPRRQRTGEVVHVRPYRTALLMILRSPIYAGAYVYGRTETRTRILNGKPQSGHVAMVPQEAWKVCLHDAHEAYITWDEYMSNQDKIASNRNQRRESDGSGPVRKGPALLQGLVLCGRCGYAMTVQQGGYALARYICMAPLLHGQSTKACWSVSTKLIDPWVEKCFLETVQPAQIDLSLAVAREVEQQAQQLEKHWASRLERARYEAHLAERRYKAVDPENRVVARTLETDWERKLREVEEIEQACEQRRSEQALSLSESDRSTILSLCKNLSQVWNAETTTPTQRKQMLRVLVRNVTLTPIDIPKRKTRVQILWHTGATTEHVVDRKRYVNGTTTDSVIVDEIRQRSEHGWTDTAIADDLNRRGIKPKLSPGTWTRESVRGIRRRRKAPSTFSSLPRGQHYPSERQDGLLSLRGLKERFGISRRTVRAWIHSGKAVPVEGGGRGRPLWFELTPDLKNLINSESTTAVG